MHMGWEEKTFCNLAPQLKCAHPVQLDSEAYVHLWQKSTYVCVCHTGGLRDPTPCILMSLLRLRPGNDSLTLNVWYQHHAVPGNAQAEAKERAFAAGAHQPGWPAALERVRSLRKQVRPCLPWTYALID
eukprot:1151279-Pelagomonas_calceolata.AAC.6